MAHSPTSPLPPAGPPASFAVPPDEHEAQEEGHAARIDHLFREHNDALVRFLSARLGSFQDAREVAQEAYVRLLNLDRPGAANFLKALLYKTAANLAIDRLRHRSLVVGHQRTTSTAQDLFAAPADAVPAALDDVRVLSQALSELPLPCRSAFLMSRVESLDSSEIAIRLGVTDRAVRKYIARALVFLQLRLQAAHTPRAP
jgi:RNA polymerase sigma factor (sigma-70 family)